MGFKCCKNKWQYMESATKDRPILLNVGLPWAVVGVWNGISNEWIYASFQCEIDGLDTYFENEWDKNPVAWMELPDIKKE
jgi:hypothetical protein